MEKKKRINTSKNIYIWLSFLTVLTLVIAAFTYINWNKLTDGTTAPNSIPSDSTLNVIIGIAGFLAAFSAISIYSIFNANVDRERGKIESLREELDTKAEGFKIFDKNMQSQINQLHYLFHLTSPYTASDKKLRTVKNLSNMANITSNTKQVLLEYYLFIDKFGEEKLKTYYISLQKLLQQWKLLDKNFNPVIPYTKEHEYVETKKGVFDQILSFLHRKKKKVRNNLSNHS